MDFTCYNKLLSIYFNRNNVKKKKTNSIYSIFLENTLTFKTIRTIKLILSKKF